MKAGSKLLVGILAAGIILSTIAGISFAAAKGEKVSKAQGFVAGCQGGFSYAIDDLSKLLGLKADQINEKQRKGESLADIAKSKGVSEDKVVSTIIERCKRRLDERVKAGTITQEQGKSMLDRMRARISERVKTPGTGSGCGMGSGSSGHRGMNCSMGSGASGHAGMGCSMSSGTSGHAGHKHW